MTPRNKNRRKGFALLITITLLAFLVLLLVSLASLTRVETSVAKNGQDLSIARAHALLALNIAIGRVQQLTGPDQRITTTADLEVGGAGALAPKVGARYWTGVWGNTKSTQEVTSTPVLLNWLVSGNEASVPTFNADGSVLAAGTAAVFTPDMEMPPLTTSTHAVDDLATGAQAWRLLVGSGTAGDATEAEKGYIAAPLVSLKVASNLVPGLGATGTALVGGYAYWVGDEGQKARANIVEPEGRVNPSAAEADKARSLRYRIPGRVGLESMTAATSWLTSFDAITRSGDEEGARLRSELTNTLSGSQLALNGALPPDFEKARFHDVTLYSNGVLSNTLKGGLKKDLTAGFAPGTTETNAPTGLMWDGLKDSGTVVTATLGARWQLLRSWYQFSEKTGSSLVPQRQNDGSGGQHGLSPVVAHWQWYVEARMEEVAPSVPAVPPVHSYCFVFRIYPALVLWNPYNVTLAGQTYTGHYGNGENLAATPSPPLNRLAFILRAWNKTGAIGDVPAAFTKDAQFVAPWTSEDPVRPFQFTVASGDMPPGVAYIYTMKEDVLCENAAAYNKYILTRGWNFAGTNPTGLYARSAVFSLPTGAVPADYGTSYWVSSGTKGADLAAMSWNMPISGVTDSADWGVIGSELFDLRLGGATVQTVGRTNASFRTATVPGLWRQELGPGSLGFYGQRWALKASKTDALYTGGSASEAEYNNAVRWLANYNPRATYSSRSPFEDQNIPSNGYFNTNPSYNRTTKSSERAGTPFDPTAVSFNINHADPVTAETYVGISQGAITNDPQPVVLFDVPRPESRLLSIGSLQHANPYRPTSSVGWASNYSPAYAIGNSLMDPRVGPSRVRMKMRDVSNKNTFATTDYLYDHSYLHNRSLWDGYYFSSVPAAGAVTFPLDNTRYTSHESSGAAADIAALRNYDKAAAHLLVSGAFNINSTSAAAWRGLLASFNKVPAGGFTPDDQQAPYPRTATPGAAFQPTTTEDASVKPEAYRGFRVLTRTQINRLADEIVKQVKLRGPFVSLSDFINRSLSASSPGRLMGPLAQAIEDAGINTEYFKGEVSVLKDSPALDNSSNDMDRDANAGQTAAYAPGWVTQADLLQSLGPVLSARSDTFVIRAYGENINPVTEVVAGRAWCEAVVQRVPDYVETGHDAWEDTAPVHNGFGRRYKIIQFRWLSPSEI